MNNLKSRMNKILDEEATQALQENFLTLADQLKAKRVQLAKKRADELRKLDRHIQLLEGSDAESIVKAAQEALYEGE